MKLYCILIIKLGNLLSINADSWLHIQQEREKERGSNTASTHLSKVTTSLDKVNLSPSVTLSIGIAASIITNTPDTALIVFTAATVVRSSPRA